MRSCCHCPLRLRLSRSTEYDGDYIVKNPCITELSTEALLAVHEVRALAVVVSFLTRCPSPRAPPLQVNTERTIHKPTGIRHVEGGWPENVDSSEIDQVDRFLKKAVKVSSRARMHTLTCTHTDTHTSG